MGLAVDTHARQRTYTHVCTHTEAVVKAEWHSSAHHATQAVFKTLIRRARLLCERTRRRLSRHLNFCMIPNQMQLKML